MEYSIQNMKKRRIDDMIKGNEGVSNESKKKKFTEDLSSNLEEVSMRVSGAPGKIHFPKFRDGAEFLVNQTTIARILDGVEFDINTIYNDSYCLKWKRKKCGMKVGNKTYHPRNLVYNLYVGEIKPKQKVVQLCGKESICLQPRHLILQTKQTKIQKISGITKDKEGVKQIIILPAIANESQPVILLDSEKSSQNTWTTSLESCITDSDCTSCAKSHT